MNTLTDAQRDRVIALLRAGKTLRAIEHQTGHRRETIAAYGRRAGVLSPSVIELAPRGEPASLCEPHRATIEAALDAGVSLRTVYAHLVEQQRFTGSYSTLKRYVRLRLGRSGSPTLLAA